MEGFASRTSISRAESFSSSGTYSANDWTHLIQIPDLAASSKSVVLCTAPQHSLHQTRVRIEVELRTSWALIHSVKERKVISISPTSVKNAD
jgi:hypothetical protein